MAGGKMSAKAGEEVEFMEQLITRVEALARPIEEYATAKKNADAHSQVVTRALSEMRQHAMMKNLGPVADAAGVLSVQCGRGSQLMRARTMREGVAAFKQLLDRMIKATIDADARQMHEKEVESQRAKEAEHAAAKRMAERVLREEQLAAQKSPSPPEPEAKP